MYEMDMDFKQRVAETFDEILESITEPEKDVVSSRLVICSVKSKSIREREGIK